MTYITEIRKSIPKFTWKHKRPRIAKTEQKSYAGVIITPNFKVYYRNIAIKTSWY
jgi:hypothetical protein